LPPLSQSDVFYEGDAGPYKLLVTIRPPQVIPGVAEVEIRSLAADVRQIHIVPLRLTAGQQFAPVPDLARPSKEDSQYYTGSLWLMATGSWKVRVDVEGARGNASLAVPVPALATRMLAMQNHRSGVVPLGLLLVLGLVAVVEAPVYARRNPTGRPSRCRACAPFARGDGGYRRRLRHRPLGGQCVVELGGGGIFANRVQADRP
jgi:hypothetical protein